MSALSALCIVSIRQLGWCFIIADMKEEEGTIDQSQWWLQFRALSRKNSAMLEEKVAATLMHTSQP